MAALIGMGNSANAQDRVQVSAANEGEIVVTAQRRAQSLQNVPISVSVVTGDSLQKAAIRSIDDLANRLPAVRITQAPAADILNIRGFGSGINSGFEQAVATFVDGSYRGRSRAIRAALFDIERVEVLKGPQTTFFGNNAIAGALNITTRKPGNDFQVNGSALHSLEGDDEFSVEGGISLPVTDRLSVRAATRWSGMNGFIWNDLVDQSAPHQRDWVGRLSIAWEPVEGIKSNARLDRGVLRQEGYLASEVIGCPSPYASIAGYTQPNVCTRYLAGYGDRAEGRLDLHTSAPSGHSHYIYDEAAITNRVAVGDHALTATTSYFKHHSRTLAQLIPLPVAGVGGGALFPNASNEGYHSLAQEIRLESPTGGFIEYMLGAYYSRSKLSADLESGFFFAPFGVFAAPVTTAATPVAGQIFLDQKDRTFSGFGSLALNPTERLQLSLGLRYSVVRKRASRLSLLGTDNSELTNFVSLPDTTQDTLRAILGGSAANYSNPVRTDRKFMPSINLRYKFDEDFMTYASYTKGFKAGGFGGSSLPDEFGPEDVDAYEAGAKLSLLGRKLFLSIAAFRSEYKGLQEASNIFTPAGTILSVIRNVGGARSQGIELAGSFRISSALSFNSEMSWLDAKYTSFANAPCTSLQTLMVGQARCVQDLSGKRRPWAPTLSGTVGASLALPVSEYQLRIDPSLYVSKGYYQSATIDAIIRQPGFAKLDAVISFGPTTRVWEVSLIGRNLTDERTASFRNNVGTSFGTVFAVPDRGRSVSLQISFRR
ncbi:MAG: TonB-dependent receptor [Sphingobium sp.]|uniref:TonB-dependent receptor n=1 Tax=Sphingobium cupriresistens TaxID=1132417 RepID=UPI001A27BD66|nr:TonB-dependent receptor [Sphingobium sp.]